MLLQLIVFSNVLCLHDKHLHVSSYQGYQVHRCQATTQEHLQLLDHLGLDEGVELWTEPSLVRDVDVMTVAGEEVRVMEMMRDNDIHCSTYINDVQALIDEDDANNKLMREHSSQDEFNLTIYHDYPEVDQNIILKVMNSHLQTMAHLDDLASQYDFIETEVIGQSWEGRDLKIIKICKDGCGNKPAIWIDGGRHQQDYNL